jgi:hypothetical protein
MLWNNKSKAEQVEQYSNFRKCYDPAARDNINRRAKIALDQPISEEEKNRLVAQFYTKQAKLNKRKAKGEAP